MTQTLRHKRLAKNIRIYPTMKEAKIKSGYSPSYAHASHHKKTKGFQEIFDPILKRYLEEEERLLKAAKEKDLTQEQYKTLIDALDKVRKQIQLLSGFPTERTETLFDDEQIKQIAGRILAGDKPSEEKTD